MTDQQVLDDAAAAQRLLNDPLLLRALDRLERDCWEAWKAAPTNDEAAQREAKRLAWTADKFRSLLTQYVNEGKALKARIVEQEDDGLSTRWRRSLRSVA